jgi:hypothetical protein
MLLHKAKQFFYPRVPRVETTHDAAFLDQSRLQSWHVRTGM